MKRHQATGKTKTSSFQFLHTGYSMCVLQVSTNLKDKQSQQNDGKNRQKVLGLGDMAKK